ncbi:MAG TPA: hypothetical protein HA321_01475 [Halobacteriales archaeon]|jgi:hypothetical protein|nr:hypothetical protein [Halobacteriales archaeon]|tara:strand:+ start:1151 stop:1360 length:210 start_codon:yes stop_codon:yes gene_type:complete
MRSVSYQKLKEIVLREKEKSFVGTIYSKGKGVLIVRSDLKFDEEGALGNGKIHIRGKRISIVSVRGLVV